MNESPILDSEFAASVMAVPPAAIRAGGQGGVGHGRAACARPLARVRSCRMDNGFGMHCAAHGHGPAASRQERRYRLGAASHDAFLPLETLRDEISPIRVLHDAVTFSTIADMGPILPLLSSTPLEHHAKIDHATQVLLALERQFAQKPALH